MNLGYLLPPLILSVVASVLLFVVLHTRWRSFTNRIFALFLVSFVLWGILIFAMRASPDTQHALIWDRLITVPIFASSVFFYHFTLLITRATRTRSLKLILPVAYTLLFMIAALSTTNLIVKGMQLKSYGYAPIAGPLFLPHVLLTCLFGVLGLINLVNGLRVSRNHSERNQISYITAGIAAGLILGTFDLLPLLGLPLYPGAIIGNIIFTVLATIAVVRHHLLDIRIVIRKSATYFLMSALVAIPYVGIILFFTAVLKTRAISPWFYLLLLIALAIALQPLWSRVQRCVDKWFYRERYAHLKALEQFSQETKDITNLDYLADSLIRLVSQAMQTTRSCLMLPDSEEKQFCVKASYGFTDDLQFALPSNSTLVHWLKRHEGFLERKELDILPQLQAATVKVRTTLAQMEAELFVPMKTRKGLAGILILGHKLSEESYSEDDMKLLMVASQQIATALDNARLYQESVESYRKLQEAQERVIASERLKALGELTSGIAHDFNNILTTILGRTQLALAKVEDGKVENNLKLIEQAALDAAGMVRRLQDFSRLRADRALDVIDFGEVLDSALEMIKPRLDEGCETLHSTIEVVANLAKISPIEGNAAELREALVNILINGIEAMPQGGKLTVKSEQEGNFAVISITDTGMGMTSEVRKRVFEPFFTTKGAEGLGMGLSVAYGIISRNKGQVSVSSNLGRGSTFTIRIPVTHNRKKEATPAQSHKSRSSNATLLVVDDDKGSRDVLCELLIGHGHKVDTACTGKEGLSLAQQKDYDLVVTDLGMPDISGRDIAAAIKIDNPKTQIILVTGWGVQFDPTELKEQGVDSVVAKPFSKDGILALVDQLLDSQAQPNELKKYQETRKPS